MSARLVAAVLVAACFLAACNSFEKLAAEACDATPGCREGDAGQPDAGEHDAGLDEDAGFGQLLGAVNLATSTANDFVVVSSLAALGDGHVAGAGMLSGRLASGLAQAAVLTPLAVRVGPDGGAEPWLYTAGAPGFASHVAPAGAGVAVLAVTRADLDPNTGGLVQTNPSGALVTTRFSGPPARVSEFQMPDASVVPAGFGFRFTGLSAPAGPTGGLVAHGTFRAVPGRSARFGSFSAGDDQAADATFLAFVDASDGGLDATDLYLGSCLDAGVQRFGDPAVIKKGAMLTLTYDVASTCVGSKNTFLRHGEATLSSVASQADQPGLHVGVQGGEHLLPRADLPLVANDLTRDRFWVPLGPPGNAGVARIDPNQAPPNGRLDVSLGSLNGGGQVVALAVHPTSGAVYELGSFVSTITQGGFRGTTSAPNGAAFLTKIDASGVVQGLVVIDAPSGGNLVVGGLAVEDDGVWVSVTYYGAFSYQGRAFSSTGSGAAILRLRP